MPNYWSSKGLVVMEKPSGVGVPAEGSLLSAQRCGSPSLAPWGGSGRGRLCRIRRLWNLSCLGPITGH
jgi:hypothetical protein